MRSTIPRAPKTPPSRIAARATAPSRARHRRKIFHAIYPRPSFPRVALARDAARVAPRATIEPYPQSRYPSLARHPRASARASIDPRCARRIEGTYGDDFFAAVVFTLAVTLIEEAVMENIVGERVREWRVVARP